MHSPLNFIVKITRKYKEEQSESLWTARGTYLMMISIRPVPILTSSVLCYFSLLCVLGIEAVQRAFDARLGVYAPLMMIIRYLSCL